MPAEKIVMETRDPDPILQPIVVLTTNITITHTDKLLKTLKR